MDYITTTFGTITRVWGDTSLSHKGAQKWYGDERDHVVHHAKDELIYPGLGSDLDKITRDAWKCFNDRTLPSGNLLK